MEATCFLTGLHLAGEELFEFPLSCSSPFVRPRHLYAFFGGDLLALDVSFLYLTDPEARQRIQVDLTARDVRGDVVVAYSVVSTDPRLGPQAERVSGGATSTASLVRRVGVDLPDRELLARIHSIEVTFTLLEATGCVDRSLRHVAVRRQVHPVRRKL